MDNKVACLTLDLEQDYGRIDAYEAFVHIEKLARIVDKYHVKLTTFVVGNILDQRQKVIEELARLGSEFELHSYTHSLTTRQDMQQEIREAKRAYVDYFGVLPSGYRSPQCKVSQLHFRIVKEEGFLFDSSVLPSWRPGIYNNLKAPTKPYHVDGLLEIPFSVIPKIHLPITMSYMKLLGWGYDLPLRLFGTPDIVIFGFHLHDLFRTGSVNKLAWPYRTFHNRNASDALGIFERFVSLLQKKGYTFCHMKELAQSAPERALEEQE